MGERDCMNIEMEKSAQHWWWKFPVSAMALKAPCTIGTEVTCQDAIEIMDREGFDQLPVLNESGYGPTPFSDNI